MENSNPYQQFLPHNALAQYVECFWIMQAPDHLSRASERLPADGRVEVLFNFAGPSKRLRADGSGQPHLQRTSFLMGGRSRGYVVEQIGASHYVAVRFRPGGLFPFTGIPLADVVDQIIDLDLIWGNAVKRLEEQLFDAASPQTIVEILNRALLERVQDISHLRQIQTALRMIDLSCGNISVRDLADQFGWSQKHFERLFAQYVGFQPKRYARISRFQQVIAQVARHSDNRPLGKLAADFGYFDQSHFVKDFTTFTGVPPSVFFSTVNHIVEYLSDPSV